MTELDETLDRIVPAFADVRGDWDDVLRRAGVRPGRSRRRALAAAVTAAAAAALVSTPALGLRGHVVRLFESRQPPRVALPKAADLSTVRVALIRVGAKGRVVTVHAALWKGHDGVCYVFTGIGSACITRGRRSWELGYGAVPGRPGRWLVHGATFDRNAASLEVRYASGDSARFGLVRIGAPIDVAFYAADVPAPRRPAMLLTRDAGGSVIARARLRADAPVPE